MIDSALELANRGWAVFPLRPRTKIPATEHGCKDATTNPSRLEKWWTRHPDCNIGIATGQASGVWALDVDGADGERSLEGFGHTIPATSIQSTPSGGRHFLFAWLPGLGNTARRIGPGLDTRGEGGYIVAAPSVTDVGAYQWQTRWALAQIPGWLIRIIRPVEPEREQVKQDTRAAAADAYVAAAVRRECDELASMSANTGRNDKLNRAAFALGGFVAAGALDGEVVYDRLLQAASACGLVHEDGIRTCRNTIASGLSAGIKHPRAVS